MYHKEHNILPIAKSAFNFIKFDWGLFRFIDSRRFLNSSEEKLANQIANRTDNKDGTLKKDQSGNVTLTSLSNYELTSRFIQSKDFDTVTGYYLQGKEHFLMSIFHQNIISRQNCLY